MRPVRSVPGEGPGPGARVVDPGLSLGQALRPFRARFLWAGVYFVVVALIGTAGYVIIEGWTWFDALYMAVTTVASVGFMELAGRSLADARIPQRTGLIVLALRRPDASEGFVYNPGPETELRAGDVMIVLGDPSQVQKLRAYVTGAKLPA